VGIFTGVDQNTLLWTLVVFFGGTVLFGAIRNLTADESVGVRIGAQALAAAIVIGALVLFVRRVRR
jgi:hypothetical protein